MITNTLPLPTALTGIGICTMGCPNCSFRVRYNQWATLYYEHGLTLQAIATQYNVARQFIHRGIQRALKYGYQPPSVRKESIHD